MLGLFGLFGQAYKKDESCFGIDNTMSTEYETAEEKAEAIKDFRENFYKKQGERAAIRCIEEINGGLTYREDPIYYMDDLANQEGYMMSFAIYLNENCTKPEATLRRDYLSNKFITALNKACTFLGYPVYVPVDPKMLTEDREIQFDAPVFERKISDDPEVQELNDLCYKAYMEISELKARARGDLPEESEFKLTGRTLITKGLKGAV